MITTNLNSSQAFEEPLKKMPMKTKHNSKNSKRICLKCKEIDYYLLTLGLIMTNALIVFFVDGYNEITTRKNTSFYIFVITNSFSCIIMICTTILRIFFHNQQDIKNYILGILMEVIKVTQMLVIASIIEIQIFSELNSDYIDFTKFSNLELKNEIRHYTFSLYFSQSTLKLIGSNHYFKLPEIIGLMAIDTLVIAQCQIVDFKQFMIIMEDMLLICVILVNHFFVMKVNENTSPSSQKCQTQVPLKITTEDSPMIINTDHKQIPTVEDINLKSEKNENQLDIIYESKAEKDYSDSNNSSPEIKPNKNNVKKSKQTNCIKFNSNNGNLLNSNTEQKSDPCDNANLKYYLEDKASKLMETTKGTKTIVYDFRITEKSHLTNISTSKFKDDNKINTQISRKKPSDSSPSLEKKSVSETKIRKHDFEKYCNEKSNKSTFKLESHIFKASEIEKKQLKESGRIKHYSCPPNIMIKNGLNNISDRSTPTNLIHSDDTKDRMENHKKTKKQTSLRRLALLNEQNTQRNSNIQTSLNESKFKDRFLQTINLQNDNGVMIFDAHANCSYNNLELFLQYCSNKNFKKLIDFDQMSHHYNVNIEKIFKNPDKKYFQADYSCLEVLIKLTKFINKVSPVSIKLPKFERVLLKISTYLKNKISKNLGSQKGEKDFKENNSDMGGSRMKYKYEKVLQSELISIICNYNLCVSRVFSENTLNGSVRQQEYQDCINDIPNILAFYFDSLAINICFSNIPYQDQLTQVVFKETKFQYSFGIHKKFKRFLIDVTYSLYHKYIPAINYIVILNSIFEEASQIDHGKVKKLTGKFDEYKITGEINLSNNDLDTIILLVKMKEDLHELSHEDIECCSKYLQNILPLFREFLDCQIGKITMDVYEINLRDVINDIIISLKIDIDGKSSRVKIRGNTEMLESNFPVDENKFVSILFQLISNAVKYSEINSDIYVDAIRVREDLMAFSIENFAESKENIDKLTKLSKFQKNNKNESIYNIVDHKDLNRCFGQTICSIFQKLIGTPKENTLHIKIEEDRRVSITFYHRRMSVGRRDLYKTKMLKYLDYGTLNTVGKFNFGARSNCSKPSMNNTKLLNSKSKNTTIKRSGTVPPLEMNASEVFKQSNFDNGNDQLGFDSLLGMIELLSQDEQNNSFNDELDFNRQDQKSNPDQSSSNTIEVECKRLRKSTLVSEDIASDKIITIEDSFLTSNLFNRMLEGKTSPKKKVFINNYKKVFEKSFQWMNKVDPIQNFNENNIQTDKKMEEIKNKRENNCITESQFKSNFFYI